MHGSLTEPEFSQQDVPLQSRDQGESQPEDFPLKIQKTRQPGVPVAICFMFGITSDRLLDLPWTILMTVGTGMATFWVIFHLKKNSTLALASLLGCCLMLGGLRHHLLWSTFQSNEISFFASEESQLVNLTGTVATQLQIHPRIGRTVRTITKRYKYRVDSNSRTTLR
jgi:hypothetical protein